MDKTTLMTLVYLVDGGRVLLGRKGKVMNVGNLTGPGGKVDIDYSGDISVSEDFLRAEALREVCEETDGVRGNLEALEKRAIILAHTPNFGQLKIHTYILTDWNGEPKGTQELQDPRWYPIDQLPFDKMRPSDKLWLSKIIDGQKLRIELWFSGNEKLLAYQVDPVPNFSMD